MKSVLPKVLHRVAGLPLIDYVLATAAALAPRTTTVVIGHGADALRSALSKHANLGVVVQEPQRGTGHALLAAESALQHATGTLVLLSGDVPLLSPKTLRTLADRQISSGVTATVITAVVDHPFGYGRIVRSGVYAFALSDLFALARTLAPRNIQGEYYVTDLVALLVARGLVVNAVTVSNPDEICGINSRSQLAEVSRIVRNQKTTELMAAGVTIDDPATAYIDRDVVVGADTVVHPGVSIEGRSSIGAGCEIHSGVRIVDSQIGDRVTILNHCVITDSRIADDARVGPFAHLRNEADVREQARVGNFVEVKRAVLGAGSKSMHLTYLGDATIGEKVNIGAGTITCNYDGEKKNQTIIEDGAFIGSDTQLVAPVRVGKGAYVGSGSTVRHDVPPGALAVSAGTQRNFEGWADKKKKKT
ncbi:MAG: bifunctional N-acetylglucosamine-1-phosphate uridyltransferase/glucosamine-1-phosphate acetyltransferase [Acidobacteria bacterium]|nr:bifunctional N-acetylglucosamine-1-phosphate uridyltransferase/glucosamine-1-phosphate acetyltransferase [Acidobacteriota bacterium]